MSQSLTSGPGASRTTNATICPEQCCSTIAVSSRVIDTFFPKSQPIPASIVMRLVAVETFYPWTALWIPPPTLGQHHSLSHSLAPCRNRMNSKPVVSAKQMQQAGLWLLLPWPHSMLTGQPFFYGQWLICPAWNCFLGILAGRETGDR